MVQKIERDVARFKEIVRGRIRQDLRKYLSHGEMIGKRGRDLVSIPLPSLDIPHFRYGDKGNGGVGTGEGDVGQPLGPGQDDDGTGSAGDGPGQHLLEVDVSLEELAEILGEELELPRIEPKGQPTLVHHKDKYTGISQTGPESLRHFKRTFKRALKRQLATNTYRPEQPLIVPIKEDHRYRTWKTVSEPQANAAIIYMMDVSGSMGDEQKEIVRIESFWIDTWLRSQYEGIEVRYIVHDAEAAEVDQETFFHTRESGGTRISSAYRLALDIMERDFPRQDWNIYALHFSDGDNWGDDDDRCLHVLKERLVPAVNLFGYGQVTSPYGSGRFVEVLRSQFGEIDNVAVSEIPDRDGILESIKVLLGKGK
ncbi:hypothetical protein Pan216_08140 [Planctomycetes bacterium Pan216]|uniref:DUF444 family protein n=1 Tax=Kolteria novifilia TaxID=2527975 RepID=A0A518AZ17_9BACT|nr:hypothetical protein Pan216_08140 [Planctomycetes bacterium Pan216]